jgi:hypothetical protein
LQDQLGHALRQSGHFIAQTKVNSGAIASDPGPRIGLLQEEKDAFETRVCTRIGTTSE